MWHDFEYVADREKRKMWLYRTAKFLLEISALITSNEDWRVKRERTARHVAAAGVHVI